MATSDVSWRSAIGTYYNIAARLGARGCLGVKGYRHSGNSRISVFTWSLVMIMAITTLKLFLLMSGIESNPGPNESDSSSNASQTPIDSIFKPKNSLTHSPIRNRSNSGTKRRLDSSPEMSASTDVGGWSEKLDDLKNLVLQNAKILSSINERMSSFESTLSQIKNDLETTKKECGELRAANDHLSNQLSNLQSRINHSEDYNRRNNLIFYNLSVKGDASPDVCLQTVREYLKSDLKIKEADSIPVDAIHTLPRRARDHRPGSSVPVIVRFISRRDKDSILKCFKSARKNSVVSHESVRVAEDFCGETRKIRAQLYEFMNRAFNEVFEATQRISCIFNLDLSDLYYTQICNWLVPVTAKMPTPSDDETFIACGQGDMLESSDDLERINLEKAICLLLGLPNDMMANVLVSLSTKFSNQSPSHWARFLCCLVSVADSDLVASVSGQQYSDLLEHLRHLMCAAEMSGLHLPYTVEMFHSCDKLELIQRILTNHARGIKVLTFCIKACLEFKIWNSHMWLIILQKLSEMMLTEELQGVLYSSAGGMPYLWSKDIFIRAWNSLICRFFERGSDDDENREIIKNIYKSLLRCPCAMQLDALSLPEKFHSSCLLPSDIFNELEVSSIIVILHQVILGKIAMTRKNSEVEKEPKPWHESTFVMPLSVDELMHYPPMKQLTQESYQECDSVCEETFFLCSSKD